MFLVRRWCHRLWTAGILPSFFGLSGKSYEESQQSKASGGLPLNQPVSPIWGTAMMIGGTASALLWRYGFEFGDAVFDVLPGMLGGFLIFGASVLWRNAKDSGAH